MPPGGTGWAQRTPKKADEALLQLPVEEPLGLPAEEQWPCGISSQGRCSKANEVLAQALPAEVSLKPVEAARKWHGSISATSQSTLSCSISWDLPGSLHERKWRGGISATSRNTPACSAMEIPSSLFDRGWCGSSTRACFILGERPCSLFGEQLNRCLLAAHEEHLASETGSDCTGLQLVNFKRAVRLMSKFNLSESDVAVDAFLPLVTQCQ